MDVNLFKEVMTPLDFLYENRHKVFQHDFVDMLYETYKYLDKEPKYRIICTYIWFNKETGEFYVGSGDKDKRECDHLRTLENGRLNLRDENGDPYYHHCNYKFQRAYNENQNFQFHFVIMNSRKEAFAFEQIMLDVYYGAALCLNIARYVELAMLGKEVSEETRKKQSISIKKQIATLPEEVRLNRTKNAIDSLRGVKHTPEQIEKNSLAQKKFYSTLSDEDIIERNKLLNEAWSDISLRAYMSVALTGNVNAKGYKHTPEQIEKAVSPQRHPFIVDDEYYIGRNAGARGLGVSKSTIEKYVNDSERTNWYDAFDMYCRAIRIFNVIYSSVLSYSEAFDLDKEIILSYIQNPNSNYDNYQWA